jgi:hypothetical protein
MQGYQHVPIDIHRARVIHDNNIQHGETYYVVLWSTVYTRLAKDHSEEDIHPSG